MFIAVLEDDARRLEAMRRILSEIFPEYAAVFFDNAPDMLAWLHEHLMEVSLLCLDHDLGPSRLRNGERFEPGCGRDVTDFLATRQPCCPVVIHTSNTLAAPGMLMVLEPGGWIAERVIPFDDLAWLERSWLSVLQERLRSASLPSPTALDRDD